MAEEIEGSSVFRRSAGQVSCTINGEVAILSLEKAVYFGLQGAGVQIWEALEQPRSVDDLCRSVMSEFEVSPEQCRKDVVRLLAEMRKEGLVESVD
ncbi:Coenzyme PQQ synthesis protein D (PqqD) [Enhydrobacter aerosaccus]|uniref:Coenzyme PQQ synthesis protein D (PqqD) n=1 Tax=Enhydrobacter aerosaccus TaxID=225324 RepID=A0A1T4SYZ2_9HYPH|nr:PqqD family protein [Enhydrobacter aerosaccus]SKA33349.1 Coenzyme PQQ synthesis protein D (PqqD) [Enhydrobacter aerosaccus]